MSDITGSDTNSFAPVAEVDSDAGNSSDDEALPVEQVAITGQGRFPLDGTTSMDNLDFSVGLLGKEAKEKLLSMIVTRQNEAEDKPQKHKITLNPDISAFFIVIASYAQPYNQ